jgi:hypothetical protein
MATSYNVRIVSDGLVFYLDAANPRSYAGTGNTSYSLIGSINGSNTAGVGFSASSNGSFTFANTTDHINFGNPSVLQGLQLNMTLSCWFNQKTNKQYATLYADYSTVNSHRLVSLFRVDSGSLRYFTTTSDGNYQFVTPTTINNGSWYYAAVSVSGTLSSPFVNIFVNGTTYSYSLSAMSSTPSTSNNHCVGGNVYIAEYFDGNISQVQIHNRALSVAEIRQNYNATKGRYGL